jgi:hypothetical protein
MSPHRICIDRTKGASKEPMTDTPDLSPPRYYHATKADLRPGDLIEPGHPPGAVRQAVRLWLILDGRTDWGAGGSCLRRPGCPWTGQCPVQVPRSFSTWT